MTTTAAAAVLAAIRERRSVRKYTAEPVGREGLLAVLDAGRWAPSGKNNQPWRFLVVTAGDPRRETLAGLTKYRPIVASAGALIVVLLDKSVMYNQVKDHQSAGAVIQNMLLAAHAMGLGAVWLGEILNREPEVLGALGLSPAAYELMVVIALGRPAAAGVSSRKPLEDLMLEPI